MEGGCRFPTERDQKKTRRTTVIWKQGLPRIGHDWGNPPNDGRPPTLTTVPSPALRRCSPSGFSLTLHPRHGDATHSQAPPPKVRLQCAPPMAQGRAPWGAILWMLLRDNGSALLSASGGPGGGGAKAPMEVFCFRPCGDAAAYQGWGMTRLAEQAKRPCLRESHEAMGDSGRRGPASNRAPTQQKGQHGRPPFANGGVMQGCVVRSAPAQANVPPKEASAPPPRGDRGGAGQAGAIPGVTV
jgi:hypothetical protein